MGKKKESDITSVLAMPRGVRVNHQDGSRDFLRRDSVPAARKALEEGVTDPWVAVAVEAWDDYVAKSGGEAW